MRYRCVRYSLTTACLLGISLCPTGAHSKRELGVWVESHGSVPPIPDWFSCVGELHKEPYDKAKAQACLQSILSHPEILKGKASFHRYKERDALTFHLESPPLTVTDVDLDVGPADLAKVHELLAINGGALHPGAIYTYDGEASSTLVLDLLLRSSGKRAGISRTVRLDYKQKTAQVAFKIWDGPPGNPEPLVPPYAEPCKIMNGYFNWTDADDLSPVSFVQGQMKTKWTGCFSEADVKDDLAALKEMKFLAESNISLEGSGNMRSISVHLRSNPIAIGDIRVKGYGLVDGLVDSDTPPLSIHVGETYRRSVSRQAAKELKKAFMKDDRTVRVFTDVEISSEGKAKLEFGILAYPNGLVYVNGVKFNGSFPDNADVPD